MLAVEVDFIARIRIDIIVKKFQMVTGNSKFLKLKIKTFFYLVVQ